jgi:fatty-acyl-CoA synthase
MAGSPCPVHLMNRVISEMKCTELTVAYGQTETAPVSLQSFASDPVQLRCETVGSVLPGVEVQLRENDGQTVVSEIGREAELYVRGHGVFLGYYKDPAATKATFTADGWLRSGDLATARPAGDHTDHRVVYQISGRLKDLIIRGGENISPREIEETLFTHPRVLQAAVFGVPDERLGEVVYAWVQKKKQAASSTEEDDEQLAKDLKAFCAQSLAKFKVPSVIRFVSEFPQTVSGKIQKFVMRDAERERATMSNCK